ncbi:rRNA-processing protein fcf1 [Paramecium bursaria]
MGKQTKVKKFATIKRMIGKNDPRIKKQHPETQKKEQPQGPNDITIREITQEPSHLFFRHNPSLGPPYRIILDTNFINFSIQNKLDIIKSTMDCLLGKCIPYVTDCIIAEMEKLGQKTRLALRLTKDPRFEKLTCDHKGTYADDCIVNRVKQHRCFIVGTCDKDLKRRIRKIPGVPIMYIQNHKYTIERMPDAYGAPK